MRGGEGCRGGEKGGAGAKVRDDGVRPLVAGEKSSRGFTREKQKKSLRRKTGGGPLTLYINTEASRWLTDLNWCRQRDRQAARTQHGEQVSAWAQLVKLDCCDRRESPCG